jgi:mannose-1-phosphate guanylyltransferase
MEHFYAMIMAGGGGTRLWPMSRAKTPKQLLPLLDEHSMFRSSVERLQPLFAPHQIYVVSGQQYAEALRDECPEIPHENFIIEPYGRDSGPAALLGLTVIEKRDPEAVVAILTADHHIGEKQRFRNALTASYKLARQERIVTLGISPAFPATGFGYIRRGDMHAEMDGFQAFESRGFTEKPNATRAIEFLTSGEYSWNSGMFIWRARQGLQEFERQQPTMYQHFHALREWVDTDTWVEQLDAHWEQITKISLDYAVMEGAKNMTVIPVDIGWSDIGSWDALLSVLQNDIDGNAVRGEPAEHVMIDTKNTLIYATKLTVTIGLEDIVIIDTEDALMVCRKDRAQDVKTVVNELKKKKQEKYL